MPRVALRELLILFGEAALSAWRFDRRSGRRPVFLDDGVIGNPLCSGQTSVQHLVNVAVAQAGLLLDQLHAIRGSEGVRLF